ncbi:DUF2381 family protein [Vitiosangium sp. GDMCC 1.1324]|uniref:DUF2381 family protein n=1 Tax=Vitiosangium sp. (strain GDMCC 1.1324) TaxID=2138576 RepID=UPI00130E9B1E|nr:DUF2381 family protein [Vitiosangium sp. GDMCC 1.1324]
MLKLPLSVLLLAALPSRAATVSPLPPIECGAELQNVELEVGSSPLLVCVAPEVATYLRFDTPILVERTVLEGGEVSVTPSPTGVMLEATRGLAVGERRRLTIYFADGREPGSATFILVGQSMGKLRQVNVFRRERSPASLRQDADEQRQRAERCERQLAQGRGQAGPTELLERLLKLGATSGISLRWREAKPPVGQQGDVRVLNLSTTHVEVEEEQRAAAVRLRLRNVGTETWTPEGASLAAGEDQAPGNIRVLPDVSLPAGVVRKIDLIVGPTQQKLTGTYTLKLWGGGHELTLENITFQ